MTRALLFVFLIGCTGTTPVQQQAQAIDIAALALGAAGSVITAASNADARASCPDGSPPECVDALAPHWAPVDAAFGSARAALGTWLAADRLASQAGLDPVAAALTAIASFVRAYEELRAALALDHLDLPAIPPEILALVPATSGGST